MDEFQYQRARKAYRGFAEALERKNGSQAVPFEQLDTDYQCLWLAAANSVLGITR